MREQIFKEHMKTIRGYVAADKGLTEEQERIRSDMNDNRTGPAEEREDGARKRRAEGGGVGDCRLPSGEAVLAESTGSSL